MVFSRRPGPKPHRGERGQNLVEFALIGPLFFVFVFAIVDFGMGLRAWIAITNSAREGARLAAVRCATDEAAAAADATRQAVRQKAVDSSGGLLANASVTTDTDIDVDNCPGDSTESVVVTINYDYRLVTPLGGFMSLLGGGGLPSTIGLSSKSDMRLE